MTNDEFDAKLISCIAQHHAITLELSLLKRDTYRYLHRDFQRVMRNTVCPWRDFSWKPVTGPRLARKTGRSPR